MSTALRVLVIDDDEGVRVALEEEVAEMEDDTKDGPGWEVRSQGFDDVEGALIRFRPDIVVLDLLEGQFPNTRDSGNRSFERIRDVWFCPVVVYTAFVERRTFEEHPQVVQVTKGRRSEEQVLAELRRFVPVARMVRSVHEDFDARIRQALHDSVDALDKQIRGNGESREDILSRAVRRQVAARVDLATSVGTELRAWERFVVPPLGDDLLTADLLRLRSAEPTNAAAFCLVLTPSCDMVQSGGRESNVDEVLVAWCEPVTRLGSMELNPGEPLTSKQRKGLRRILTQGMEGEYLVIPELRGHVPFMAANLKRLELVEWDRIDPRRDRLYAEGPDLMPVASTDSPFREMVVWAYLSVTGRPGMPDTDIERWVEEISSHVEGAGSK